MTTPEPHDHTATPALNRRFFLLGYAAGVLVFLLLRLLESWVLPGPCAGHTVFSLIAPLLLGPGGLAVAAANWGKRGWGFFGLGLAAASLFPALFFAAQSLGHLRAIGCAPNVPTSGTPVPPLR